MGAINNLVVIMQDIEEYAEYECNGDVNIAIKDSLAEVAHKCEMFAWTLKEADDLLDLIECHEIVTDKLVDKAQMQAELARLAKALQHIKDTL